MYGNKLRAGGRQLLRAGGRQRQGNKTSTNNTTMFSRPSSTSTTRVIQKQQIQAVIRQISRSSIGVMIPLQIITSLGGEAENGLERGWDYGVDNDDDDGG